MYISISNQGIRLACIYKSILSCRHFISPSMQRHKCMQETLNPQAWGFLLSPYVLSVHSCISVPHLMMVRTRNPPIIAKKTPGQIVRFDSSQESKRRNSQIVNVHPTPIALISGSTAAVAPAAKIYCTMYLQPIVSERAWGIASARGLVNCCLLRFKHQRVSPAE